VTSLTIRGKIYSFKNFTFHDGGTSNKLLILVSEPKGDDDWVFVKTTSQVKVKEQEGCHPCQGLFVINANSDFFRQKTWVQFHDLYPLNHTKILQAKFKGELKDIGRLREQTVRAIVNCMHKSDDLSAIELSWLK